MTARIGVPGAIFDAGNPTEERKSCLFALRAPHTGPAAATECKTRSAITQVRGFGHVGTSQPSCLTPPFPFTLPHCSSAGAACKQGCEASLAESPASSVEMIRGPESHHYAPWR